MRHAEYQYLDLIEQLLEKGDRRVDRTAVGTLSQFGAMMRFDLSDGTLPVFTTKKVFWKTAVKEMLWFLTGRTDLRSLLEQNIRIWSDWPLARYRKATGEEITQEEFEARILADAAFSEKWGDLGPIYGKQWRRWLDAEGREHDQVATVIETLKTNPSSRRMLFHAWNVPELDRMALHPCHMTYQFHVAGLGQEGVKPRLSLMVYQRSCDILLGAPFNICQQAALLHMVAAVTGMQPGELIWAGGDVHLYLNHLEQAKEQISREPYPFPKLTLARTPESIDDFRIEDFEVTGYRSHERIDAPVAV